jgi:cyclopropane fatty-acyl-phospholipid synthase-like methyltransferase
MLDVGGGPGTFSIAFAQAHPDLLAEVLDLGSVLPLAERHIREAGLSDRVAVRAGDLRTDDFGGGYDLVLVSAICHMLDEEENRDLFRRCAKALVAGGRVVIREFILDPDRSGPPGAALFALNMLVGTRRGNTYTEAEFRLWLEQAGFGEIRRPDPAGELIIGTRA